MGLDMYLTASDLFTPYSNPETHKKLVEMFPDFPIDAGSPYITVETTAVYWRKANAIHNWFVQNCQSGIDNCQRSYVSLDQIIELRNLCQKTLKTRNPGLLPPVDGFFFGGTEIDDWYWDKLQQTVDDLTKLIDNPNASRLDYHYQSSW